MSATMSSPSIVITGAASGIGLACALHFDKLGYQVFAGIRREQDIETLQKMASPRLQPLMLEVTDEAMIHAAATSVSEKVGAAGLVGLVNNAGVAVAGPVECVPLAELRRQFEVNVIGQIAVTQAFLPLLRQGHGRIVNIGSISGLIAMPFIGPYSASKYALEALNDSLRVELRPWGIHVAIIEPGAIATPIWGKSIDQNRQILESLPSTAQTLYRPTLLKLLKNIERTQRAASPVEQVVLAIAHALTSPQPRNRYIVGRDARVASWFIRVAPDWLRDWLVSR
jgi:NAD(P)-dependent dehydrogenase (short-subunit alcohol dehydrogenase family)